MVGAKAYDLMYRTYAPWDSDSPRKDLLDLLAVGTLTPERYPRAVDLGCGTGANVIHLAGLGFDALGVDFSKVAIQKAMQRAEGAGVPARFVVGDLTAESIPGVDGVFDLLMDFGTMDDLRGARRTAMARTITRLAWPGSLFLELCFYGATEDLPFFSFSGTSKLFHIAPGELEELFGDDWAIDPLADYPEWRMAAFLLTKK